MASLIRNKRRTKLITPSNSSFSNCVEDQLFIQPLRKPLETFKPVVYLDEQGRRHGRVSDHLLQRQIENDREKLKKQPIPKVPISSTLYGIRNPNIAALIRDVPVENDDDENDEITADDEVKFIEYKKSSKPATSKSSTRRISSISGKQSVKFDTTPSVNMARLVESHLTELDDIDNIDEDDSVSDDDDDDGDDEEDLDSSKPAGDSDSNKRGRTDKSAYTFSETPSTPKNNNDDDEEEGTLTNPTLESNRQSQDIQMPPTVEDVLDTEEEEKQQEQGESANELSSPEVAQQQKQSANSNEKTEERQKSSSSSRPKTAPSSQSRSENEETKSSRASSSSSSTESDDTSALLRSDNDNDSSSSLSDNEINNEDEQTFGETPLKSGHTVKSDESDTINVVEQEHISPEPIAKSQQQQDVKGEYDVSQVIQLKESFQPIINEAASYGHLDIVRDLIERGQSVHTQNLLQRTPLHEACVSGNGQLISELLDNGALIDQRDSRGMTPLHVAATHGTLKCIRILCEKGCDINARDNLGQTAAHYSAMHNHVDALKYLINIKHIDLSISNNESKLPIHYAAKHGSKNILNFFFQWNLTTNATDHHGNTVIHEACEYNQLDCIKLIWKINRELFQMKNHFGRTPIHTAALFGATDALHWLLELHVVDIDQPDNDGYTMAHLAASRGHGECFSCLITHNAQLDLYTFDRHESVSNLAKRSGKNGRIEQARSGVIRCHCCEEKLGKEKQEKVRPRNAVEQLIHTQIQRGYHLNIPVNRSSTNLSQRNHPTT